MKFSEENCILAEKGRFQIRIAVNDADVKKAQALRYQVFGEEQQHALCSAEKLDMDAFDRQFHHLLVVDTEADKTVGTYRFQTGKEAAAGRGFYSSRKYIVDGLDAIRNEVCEVSRSCVAEEYRGGAVITLLWTGFAELHRRMGFRYMMGSVWLSDQDPARCWGIYENLCRRKELSTVVFGRTRPAYQLLLPDRHTLLTSEPDEPLFKGYLRLGAQVAGEPAWDRKSHSVDFLFLLDFARVAEKYARHFDVAIPPLKEPETLY